LRGLPAGSIVMLAARAGAPLSAAFRAMLAGYGADAALPIAPGQAYLLIGAAGAPAGAAIEAACDEGCWAYIGRPWPARRLAIESVEIGP
jgi:hypothetical protein